MKNLLLKLRWKLICLLVGKEQVIMNCDLYGVTDISGIPYLGIVRYTGR